MIEEEALRTQNEQLRRENEQLRSKLRAADVLVRNARLGAMAAEKAGEGDEDEGVEELRKVLTLLKTRSQPGEGPFMTLVRLFGGSS